MKQLYTLDEIHRYEQDLADIEASIALGNLPDYETTKHRQAQIHVMREVLLRMHESLAKHGPLRPGFFSRWVAAREIRKLGKYIPSASTPVDKFENFVHSSEAYGAATEAFKKAEAADHAAATVMGHHQSVRRSKDGSKRI